MIYITQDFRDDYRHISNVWNVDCSDVEERYKKFMLDKADEIDLKVNPHWFDVLYHEMHNSHLTKTEYNRKSKQWKKFRKLWTKDKYIFEILKGEKLEYKDINN